MSWRAWSCTSSSTARSRSGAERNTIADPESALTPADRAALLALARSAITAALAGDSPPELPDVPGAVLRRGAFVTLEEQEGRSEEHTSELQSRFDLVCRLLLEKKKKISNNSRS